MTPLVHAIMKKQKSKYCRQCKEKTLHEAQGGNLFTFQENMGHGCLVILTLGLWLIPFFLLATIRSSRLRKFHCQRCGL